MDGTERNVRINVCKQLCRIRMILLQSDHSIRLALATEISMESEDSDNTSLVINSPDMSGYDMFILAPYDDKHIHGIREHKITITSHQQ